MSNITLEFVEDIQLTLPIVRAIRGDTGLIGPIGPIGPIDTSAIEAHENATNPHPQYALISALGTAAATDSSDYATAAQGGKADTALQSSDIGTTTGTVAAGDDARLLAVADKVDKVTGKGLSTEDYSTAEKSKLAGIATGANNYTHPANHPPSIITQDASNRFVTDAEKSTWNAKEPAITAGTAAQYLRGDKSWQPAADLPVSTAQAAAIVAATAIYTTEALGRAAVADGQAFKVQGSGDVAAYEYRRTNSTTSVPIAAYPSAFAVVTPDKTNFLAIGKNKFNKSTVTTGAYMTQTGAVGANAIYDYSDYIPVVPGTTYRYSGDPITGSMRFTCYFDSNKLLVAGGSGSAILSFTVPTGVYFVRISVLHADLDIAQLEVGTVATVYESYLYRFVAPISSQLLSGSLVLESGSVGASSLAAGAVSPNKTDFVVVGKNKFNKATVTTGAYMAPTGAVWANATYDYSDYIPVVPGTTYIYSPDTSGNSMRFTCYFDSNKQVVAGGLDGAILSFTVPAGVYFVRITVYHYYTDIAQLEVGTVATVYESYRYQMVATDGVPIYSATDSVVTDYSYITISAKQYVPYGKEIALYGENLVKDYPSYRGRVGISFTGGKETGPATKIIPASGQVNTTIAATATVANPAFATLSAANFSIVVTDPTKTTAANIQNLGDSYTGGMAWANVILGTAAAAGLTFSGNRDANSAAIRCEGQGGWHLSHYFTVDASGYLSPFMQPVTAGYKYYGQTAFWIDANAATPTYNAASFTSIKTQFNATTGRKVSPAVNDVMGDGGGYIVWNGSAWVTITSGTFGGFAFSYAKYRAAWSIPAPTIFHVLLGTNDFYSATETTFAATYAAYKANYDTLIASVKADTPAVKIIVGIPVSSGRQGEFGTLTTERVKRAMWLLAKSLNADYGGREAESIYVLDYHSVVDRFYGFDQVGEAPFADYTGAAGDGLYKSDITHLGLDGFKQMGNAYMGLIQFLR